MSRKILDITLSIFLIVCTISILVGGLYLKRGLDTYLSMLEVQKQAQEEMINSANEIKDLLFEVGLAAAVVSLSEEKIIPPADAEDMIAESLNKINRYSERLGKIARYINNYRINQQRRLRP